MEKEQYKAITTAVTEEYGRNELASTWSLVHQDSKDWWRCPEESVYKEVVWERKRLSKYHISES